MQMAKGHLVAGAKKVIITAPAKHEDITVVMGVARRRPKSRLSNYETRANARYQCYKRLNPKGVIKTNDNRTSI
jgi:glyceraldehyde 3-phosphate dehydrogenase